MIYIKTYILNHFYSQHSVLLTMVPRNRGGYTNTSIFRGPTLEDLNNPPHNRLGQKTTKKVETPNGNPKAYVRRDTTDTIAGDHSKEDQLLLVKMGKYVGFVCTVDPTLVFTMAPHLPIFTINNNIWSYLLCSPVIGVRARPPPVPMVEGPCGKWTGTSERG